MAPKPGNAFEFAMWKTETITAFRKNEVAARCREFSEKYNRGWDERTIKTAVNHAFVIYDLLHGTKRSKEEYSSNI